MNRFSYWLANFMRGRYGMDQFNRFILIIVAVMIIVNIFVRIRLLHYVAILLLIYTYCRLFSRNINARMRENQKFMQIISGFRRGGARGFGKSANRDMTKKVLRCPGCGEKMKVPRGEGKIKIKCPYCGTQFTKKV